MKIIFSLFFFLLFISGTVSSQVKIGVALPLMENSPNKEDKLLGEYILMGVKDALKEYNSSKPKKEVKLSIQDTKRDAATALNAMNEFGNDKNVIAIFGPIFSNELAPNSGVGAFYKIPIISPTSTQNDLAKNNEYVYQLNPTYDIRGKLMAKYAMEELKMRNFVILSEESYGKNFADSFYDEVEKRGGRVINIKYYQKEEVSVSEYLSELKNDILRYERFIDFGNLDESQKSKLEK
jgi:branched-chain amino acid transport system substrate-binding protein